MERRFDKIRYGMAVARRGIATVQWAVRLIKHGIEAIALLGLVVSFVLMQLGVVLPKTWFLGILFFIGAIFLI